MSSGWSASSNGSPPSRRTSEPWSTPSGERCTPSRMTTIKCRSTRRHAPTSSASPTTSTDPKWSPSTSFTSSCHRSSTCGQTPAATTALEATWRACSGLSHWPRIRCSAQNYKPRAPTTSDCHSAPASSSWCPSTSCSSPRADGRATRSSDGPPMPKPQSRLGPNSHPSTTPPTAFSLSSETTAPDTPSL